MADDIPTPESPRHVSPSFKRRSSRRTDMDSDSASDIVEETPEQRFSRLINEHDREFKHKLRSLVDSANILQHDYSKSIKNLKKVHREYMEAQKQQVPPSSRRPTEHEEPARKSTETGHEYIAANAPSRPSTGQPSTFSEPTLESKDRARTSTVAQDTREHSTEVGPDENGAHRNHNHTPDSEIPSAPPRVTVGCRLVDYDDDDDDSPSDDSYHHHDIEHEGTPEVVNSNMNNVPPAPDQKPSNKQEDTGKPQKTSLSARGAPARWSDEEENRMIEIIHTLMQEDDTLSRSIMWRRAEAMHRAYGYDRTFDKMAAKWSAHTRTKCEERGMAWAADVMQKQPRIIPRKRREDWLPDGRPSKYPLDSKSKKWKTGPMKTYEPNAPVPIRAPTQPSGDNSDLHLQNTFEGASAAIVDVDWSPDGNHFVVAANSIVDEEDNFKDNKPKNLFFGSLLSKTLRELPEHRVENESGQQPKYVYQTVSAVKFAKTGHRMYSGGFDHKLRVWDVGDEQQIGCKAELEFRRKRIEVMDVPEDKTACLATGAGSGPRSIRVFLGDPYLTTDKLELCPLRDSGITYFPYAPTCLRFGTSSSHNRLIAGFAQDDVSVDGNFGQGCFAVWQFTESSCIDMGFDAGDTFVSDCKWSKSGDLFVIGCTIDETKKNAKENSMVKLFSTQEAKPVTIFDCPAVDINDVTHSSGLITASCTDGTTYVWDQRSPLRPLHTLMHGDPVAKFRSARDRELNDVGVRYLEWAADCPQLYTGGSDGFLKLWDTRRSPIDVLVQNVVDLGHEILCGKFAPDHSSLLLGDEVGRIHLLTKEKPSVPKQPFEFKMAEKYAQTA